MEEKLTSMIEENKKFKQKICNLETEIEYLRKEKKSNNIIIYGLKRAKKRHQSYLKKLRRFSKEI